MLLLPLLRSAGGGNEQTFISTSQVNNVTSRLSAVEEANKALLEEIYRLQSYVRTIQHEKKGSQQNEKKLHHDVMGAIRGSNDVISELTSRVRTMEEKLHVEKENRKTLSSLSKRLEQVLQKCIELIIKKITVIYFSRLFHHNKKFIHTKTNTIQK